MLSRSGGPYLGRAVHLACENAIGLHLPSMGRDGATGAESGGRTLQASLLPSSRAGSPWLPRTINKHPACRNTGWMCLAMQTPPFGNGTTRGEPSPAWGEPPAPLPGTLYRCNWDLVRVMPFYCVAPAAIVEGALQRTYPAQIGSNLCGFSTARARMAGPLQHESRQLPAPIQRGGEKEPRTCRANKKERSPDRSFCRAVSAAYGLSTNIQLCMVRLSYQGNQ